MVNWIKRIFTRGEESAAVGPAGISVDMLSEFDGEKFLGGFGDIGNQTPDYWTLRHRSNQIFQENIYGRGIIRRLLTNEIGMGLTPEARPVEEVLGFEDGALVDWSETVERRFHVWSKDPKLCHRGGQLTFGQVQALTRLEALVVGDVLVVVGSKSTNGVLEVELVCGDAVQSPMVHRHDVAEGHKIVDGVEVNAKGEHVAFWVRQEGLKYKRVPAYGGVSRRRMAWMVYGIERRLDQVRGTPLLSLVLQSLKEIDRYRDAAQRKAVVNSILAMFIERSEDKPGTLPISGGAISREKVTKTDSTGATRKWNIAKQMPGAVIEELQKGEKPVAFTGQTDIDFAKFEEAVVEAISWHLEIPPEILKQKFASNYSASQAALNEFNQYLAKFWVQWGENFCGPIYCEWFINEVAAGRIEAEGALESMRDPAKRYVFSAWVNTEWYGSVKISADPLKQVNAAILRIENGFTTYAREARILTGTKFSTNTLIQRREVEMLKQARGDLLEKKGQDNADGSMGRGDDEGDD